jgi:hypothetical protein
MGLRPDVRRQPARTQQPLGLSRMMLGTFFKQV